MASERDLAAIRAEIHGTCAASCIRKGQHTNAAVSAKHAIRLARVAIDEPADPTAGESAGAAEENVNG